MISLDPVDIGDAHYHHLAIGLHWQTIDSRYRDIASARWAPICGCLQKPAYQRVITRAGKHGPRTSQCGVKALLIHGLEQVVKRVHVKSLQCKLIEGGDKNHIRTLARVDLGNDFKAGLARHLYVEEYQVGLGMRDRFDGLAPIAALRQNLHIVRAPKQCAKSAPCEVLIVHDERSDGHAGSASDRSGERALEAR